MALERLVPLVRVAIDGATRTLLGGSCTQGTRNSFATAALKLDPSEGRPRPGQVLTIDAGDVGAPLERTFTGEIDTGGVALSPHDLEVQATGYLGRARETIGTPPTVDDSGDAAQAYILTWESATAATIVGDILAAYGLTGSLEDSGKVFGTLQPVGLAAGASGWGLIQQLDEIEGYRTFDGPDGVVRRAPFTGIPAATGRTFAQGVDLFAGRMDESRVQTYNRVIASGLPQRGTVGVGFTPTAVLDAPSPWIPSPPTYRAYSFSSTLMEDEATCADYAARKLGELNRLRGEMPFELATGDATLRPGMSCAVDAAILDASPGVRCRVTEVVHSFDSGFQTSGTLLIASGGSGWGANQAPVAVIAAEGKRETLADASVLVAIHLDGAASYDPELGTAGIVSYVWHGSPVAPTPLDSGMRASVAYTGGVPSGAYVTLTVTDDLGKTGTTKRYLDDPAAVPLKVRDLISAELTRLQVTRDGGATWQGVTVAGSPIAAVGTCEFAAATYTFAWDAGGTLYKVLADNTASAVLSGAGITACGITLTNGDPDQPTGRVWAGGAGGATFRSRADGDAGIWEPRAAAPNGQAPHYILESPFAEGDIEMAAGNASYRSFDNGGSWAEQYAHPNTALVALRIASGFAKSWIGYSGGAGDDLGASRLRERDNAVALDFPEASKPGSVQGLTLDIAEDVAYVLDIDGGGDGRAWTGDTADGGNLAPAATWDTGAWGVPRHTIRDGTSPGYLYIAATDALLKSVDGLASIRVLKLLSGGAEGRMIGYGAERAKTIIAPVTLASHAGDERALSLWNGASNDAPPDGWYTAAFDDSAWPASISVGGSGTPPPAPGSDPVWSTQPHGRAANEAALLRRSFAVAAGTVASATLVVSVDNFAPAIYLNGQWVDGYGGLPIAPFTYDVTALVIPGATNLLAIWGQDAVTGGLVFMSFTLEIA